MAKRTDKDFRRLCRQAAVAGLANTADGKWAPPIGSMGRDMMAGYRVGEFDHPRKKKEDKTGACRNWAPKETFETRGLDRQSKRR